MSSPGTVTAGVGEQQRRAKDPADTLNQHYRLPVTCALLCTSSVTKLAASAWVSLPPSGTAPHPERKGGREGEVKHLPWSTALLLFAERTPRAGVGTSDRNGYWLVTALIFTGIPYLFFSSFYVQLEKDTVEDYVPSICKNCWNKLLLCDVQSVFSDIGCVCILCIWPMSRLLSASLALSHSWRLQPSLSHKLQRYFCTDKKWKLGY